MRRAVWTLLSLVLAAPLAVLMTLMLLPLWRWLEAATGIESIGHSGPAGWCYVSVYLCLLAVFVLAGWRPGRKPDAVDEPSERM